jgi:hypothetical protein
MYSSRSQNCQEHKTETWEKNKVLISTCNENSREKERLLWWEQERNVDWSSKNIVMRTKERRSEQKKLKSSVDAVAVLTYQQKQVMR